MRLIWLKVKIFGRVVRMLRRATVFRRAVVIIYRHENDVVPTSPVEIPKLEIRPVDASNVTDVLAMEPEERVVEFRRFLEQGDRGYYAYLDGRVVHRAWVQEGPRNAHLWHGHGDHLLGPGDAFIHYCETAVEARGRGIYPAVLRRVVADARRRGIRTITIATDLDNIASRHGIEKAGFTEFQRVMIEIRFGIGRQRLVPRRDRLESRHHA